MAPDQRSNTPLQDKPEGKLTDMWSAALSESGLPTTDVASALADLLSVKDENEIINVKKAAFMTASVMKASTVPRLEGKHSSCGQCLPYHTCHGTASVCWL